ncbi:MAG TPA: hypothetical protein VF486_05655 [Actinomycetes bacterium]
MGTLLGDADVWDDTPARPRPLRRGLVALAVGVAVGLAAGWVVAPRPAPPAPRVVLPAASPAAPVPTQGEAVVQQAAVAGPMLVTGLGKLEELQADGSSSQVVAPGLPPVAVLPVGGRLVALGGDAVLAVDRTGTATRITPSEFRARGVAGRGGEVLACGRRPLPIAQRLAARDAGRDETGNAPALLLRAAGGKATEVGLACPVAWAARAGVVAGAGGAQVRFRGTTRGTAVLAGKPGGPLRTLLDRRALEAATGPGASVGALALSPDGGLLAVAAGAPAGHWAVLLVPVRPGAAGAGVRRIALADGYEAAWLAFTGSGKELRLAVAALDRRGGLGEQELSQRAGDGYVLGYEPASRAAAVILAGPPLQRADGFAFSPDGQVLAVSSPDGWTLLRTDQPTERATPRLSGTLLAWPGGAG